MAISNREIRKKKYLPFPGHTDILSARYHSKHLPNPNVIRIEVLSPSVREQYLNTGLYAITEKFRQSLSEFFLTDECTKPFYAFFDPADDGIDFGIRAKWEYPKGKHGFNAIVNKVKPIIGKMGTLGELGETIISGGQALGGMITNAAGIDTSSTGACTMKDFSGAEFNFNKTITCKWYIPEQENMARLSISRLLKLAYVRNMKPDKDYISKLTQAASAVTSSQSWKDTMATLDNIKNEIKQAISPVTQPITDFVNDSWLGDVVNKVEEKIMPSDEQAKVAKDVLKGIANGGIDVWVRLNSFFGGNITVMPFPVRLTMGHILDIEPLVIESVEFHASKEQFISEDGTHIPLFITAKIKFGMWMIPDPSKGFIRWMGDDVFNSGHMLPSAKATVNAGTAGTSKTKQKGATKATKK